VLVLFGLVVGLVLLVVVAGEWLGVFEDLTARVPFALGLTLVMISGSPIFVTVGRALSQGRLTSHTLMSVGVGVAAALAVG
jgi:Cu+-exporting ATPase